MPAIVKPHAADWQLKWSPAINPLLTALFAGRFFARYLPESTRLNGEHPAKMLR